MQGAIDRRQGSPHLPFPASQIVALHAWLPGTSVRLTVNAMVPRLRHPSADG